VTEETTTEYGETRGHDCGRVRNDRVGDGRQPAAAGEHRGSAAIAGRPKQRMRDEAGRDDVQEEASKTFVDRRRHERKESRGRSPSRTTERGQQ
jgi:hypothetical protein